MNSLPFDITAQFVHEAAKQLTVEQEEILICLFEEAAKVTQVVANILRFDYRSNHPDGGPTNAELLQAEVGDLLGIIDRLTELELFDAGRLNVYRDAKIEKLENFLLFKNDADIVNY